MSKLTPKFRLRSFQGGRFYRGRWVYGVTVAFPAGVTWWTNDLHQGQHQGLLALLTLYSTRAQPLTQRHRRRVEQYGTEYTVSAENAEHLCGVLFGFTVLQTFYRCVKRGGYLAIPGRNWWCVKRGDAWRVHARKIRTGPYGAIIPKNLRPTFEPFIEPVPGAKIDWSKVDLGPDRKPPVYICNLCGHRAEEDGWKWGSPMAGVAGHQILGCPGCKASCGDMFDRLQVAMDGGADQLFSPRMEMQDDLWFTI
jgi:hypothetical protein